MSSQTQLKPGAAARERSPLVEMISVAAPVVATMSSYTAMQFVDALMVGRIGPAPVYIAAQGNGMVWSFVPVSGMMGLITVVNTFVSQNLGAGKAERGTAYAWSALWMSLIAWVAIMLPFAAAIGYAFEHLTNHDTRLVSLETSYARILILGSLVTLGSRAISQYFYGMHRPAIVFIAALAGNVTNIVANAFLIYGPTAPAPTGMGPVDGFLGATASLSASLGIPALGVTGAAIATVLGSAVEFVIPMAVFLSARYAREFATRTSWRFSLAHAKDIVRVGWPGAMMFVNEIVCWAYLMSALVGHFGTTHNTAGWIAMRYMHIAFMPAVGLSIAVTAQVGKCMGMGRPDLAANRAWLGLALNMGYMATCALLMIIFRREAIEVFIDSSMTPEHAAKLVEIGSMVMIAASIFQVFDALGITFIGALRGAGDTVWPGVATLILAWTFLFGGGTYMVHYQPQLGSMGPWIATAAYIMILGLAVSVRFISGKWKSIKLVKDDDAPDAAEARAFGEAPGAPTEPGQARAPTVREVLAAAGPVDGVMEGPRE